MDELVGVTLTVESLFLEIFFSFLISFGYVGWVEGK